jgi:hypothetical protein
MPTTYTPGLTLLRNEFTTLLDAINTSATIDTEDDALEELAGWAETRLGHGWEPLYDGVRLVGVAGQWMGHPITLEHL